MKTRFSLDQAAFYLTCGSALAMLFSIATSEVLLGLALITLLFSGLKLRFPPILLPLGAFFVGTAISIAVSVDPSGGKSAIRKFFVYAVLLMMASAVRTLERAKALLLAATAVMTLSALWSFVQFAHKVEQARASGRPFYAYYTSERITGFMPHWMMLGGQELMLLLMAAALLFFSAEKRWKPWLMAACAIILTSMILGYTRVIWFGTLLGGVYLLWLWKRWWTLALPIPLIVLVLLNPFELRERVRSIWQPHGDTDSNQFRYVARRAGWEMIKAHPWFGVGPQQVDAQFKKWIPADVPRPLPTGWYGHLHNVYIHYAAERGIPTLLALLWMLGKILWDFLRGALKAPPGSDALAILRGAIAVMIGMLAVGFYEVNLGGAASEVLLIFLVVVGCGYIAIDRIEEECV